MHFKNKAAIFLFGIILLANFIMVMTFVKQANDRMVRAGITESAKILTRNVR